MGIELFDPEEKKLEQRYYLKCKVLVKEISYVDEQSKYTEQRSEEMVFLVPVHNTQMELFFTAWLPEDPEEHFEVVFEAGHPIYGVFKGAVRRRNKDCPEHHIFVMSRGAEEDLKMLRGKTVDIVSLPQSEEDQGDAQKDFDLSNNRASEIVDV